MNKTKKTNHIDLSKLSDNEILKLKFCDLDIHIKGTWLEECVNLLYSELKAKGILFKPLFYLTDEWLTPNKEPVVGIPFYLAHPRLQELEKSKMHEIEGGDKKTCMMLLRHETGHAINYAYKFYNRKKWRKLFGQFSEEYTDRYKYQPYSKNFVIHLDNWYAQHHPDEDFAETFAVWLAPDSKWHDKYKNWKAIEKLYYIDSLMNEIKTKIPLKEKGKKYYNISTLKSSLSTHYKRKIEFYAEYSPDFHDSHLKKIFPNISNETDLNVFKGLLKYKKDILKYVSFWTGERKHIINQLFNELVKRCNALNLKFSAEDALSILRFTAYITSLIMNYVHTGRFKRQK